MQSILKEHPFIVEIRNIKLKKFIFNRLNRFFSFTKSLKFRSNIQIKQNAKTLSGKNSPILMCKGEAS